MKGPSYCVKDERQLTGILHQVLGMVRRALPGGPVEIKLGRPGDRTLSQNAKMWAMLTDVADQVVWHGDKHSKEDWKCILTAGLRKQRAVPGIDGGFVVLGMSSSKLGKGEFGDLIELIYAFGTQHDVFWSEKALAVYEEYARQAA